MTDGVFAAFRAASGDNHPVHMMPSIAAGAACRDAGARFPDVDPDRGRRRIVPVPDGGVFGRFLEQSSRFVKPVFVGDTLYAALEVDELAPNRSTGAVGLRSTVHNQRGELVLEGRQRYLLRRRK